MRRPIRLVAALVISACAQTPSASVPRAPAPERTHSVISEDEIATVQAMNAYEVVQRLRPSFIHWTRPASFAEVRLVYLDGVEVGGLEQLQSIPAQAIAEIRFVSGLESGGRFGRSNSAGAIVLTTKLWRGAK